MTWEEKLYLCLFSAGVALAIWGLFNYYINRK